MPPFMRPISSLSCPYCQAPAEISSLHCRPCGIKIEGSFESNEFARLNQDDLHFLRIFLQFEGRVRDMEAPLGLSYPTIRSRLSQLKEKIFSSSAATRTAAVTPLQSVLEGLERGDLSFDETLKQIKNMKKEKK